MKNKLQKWCEVVDVDEFHTSKQAVLPLSIVKWQRSRIMEKKSIVFSVVVTMSVELLLIMTSMVQGTFIWIGEDDSEREMT